MPVNPMKEPVAINVIQIKQRGIPRHKLNPSGLYDYYINKEVLSFTSFINEDRIQNYEPTFIDDRPQDRTGEDPCATMTIDFEYSYPI